MSRRLQKVLPSVAVFVAVLAAGCSVSRVDPPSPWLEVPETGPPGPPPLELDPQVEEPPVILPGPGGPPAVEEEVTAPGEGEDGAPPPDEPDAEELATGEPVRLGLDAALVAALVNNPTLEVVRFGPRIARTFVPEEMALFDPRLSASGFYEDSVSQLSAVQGFTFRDETGERQGPAILERQGVNLSSVLETLFPTGTVLSLSGTLDRSDTNFTPREYEGAWTLQVRQPLLEGLGRDVNLVALRQARNRTVQSEWRLRQAVLDTVATVERIYWDLALAQEVVEIHEFGVLLAAEQLELNQDLVDTGRAVRSVVLSAQAERASRRADLEDARGRVRALTVTLLRLLGPEGTGAGRVLVASDEPVAERVALDAEESVELALDLRPELFRERIETLNRRLDVAVAEDALDPRLDLVAEYGRTSLGRELGGGLEHLVDDSDFEIWRLGLAVDLPLFGRGELARYRRARLSEMRADAILEETAEIVVEEVRRAVIDVETQWARIGATEEAVEGRAEELRIEQDRYEVGMARNLDVLEVQRQLIEARVEAVTAKIEYLQALTDLYRAEGTLLEHRGITLAALRPDPDAVPGKRTE